MRAREGRRKSTKDKLIRCSQGVSRSHGVPRAGPSSLQVTGKGAPVEPARPSFGSLFLALLIFFPAGFAEVMARDRIKEVGPLEIGEQPRAAILVAYAAQWICPLKSAQRMPARDA
jgi:hypothetical protein